MQIAFTLSNPELQQELLDHIEENDEIITPGQFAREALEAFLADRRLDRVNAQIAARRAAAQTELF